MEKLNNGKVSVYNLMLYIRKRYCIPTSTPVLNINFIGDLNESDRESIFAHLKIEENDKEAKKAIGLCETEHMTKMLPNAEKEKEKIREEREEEEDEEGEEEEEEKKKCRSYLFNDDSTLKCNILDDNNEEIIYSLLFIKKGIFLEDYKTKQIISKTDYNPEILQFMISAVLSKGDVFLKKNNRGVSMANIIFTYTNEDLLFDKIQMIFGTEHVDKEIVKNVLFLIKTISEAGHAKSFKYLLLNGYFSDTNIKEIVSSVLLSKNVEIIRIAVQNWFEVLEPENFLSVFCRKDDDVVRFLFNSFPRFKKFLKNNMNRTISLFTTVNNPAVAAFLLNEFAINLESEEGFIAFLNAVKGGHIDVVKFLLDEYGMITMKNTAHKDDKTPLCCAVFNKNNKTPLYCAVYSGLYYAVDSGQLEVTNYLLSKFEVSLNIKYKETGETVFHCAARQKNKEIINLLLLKNKENPKNENKINFYSLDKSGSPALNYLILDKNYSLFYSLVKEYKISLTALEEKSLITPFYCFVKSGNIEMVGSYLKKGGININRQYGSRLETAIYVAIMSNNIEMTELLLKHPEIELNLPVKADSDSAGFLMPITASTEETEVDLEILKLLLSYKNLNVNATDSFGSTALHWAVITSSADKVEALLSREDLNLNAVDDIGSALYHCYNEGEGDEVKIQIINILLKDERLETTTMELDLIEKIVIKQLNYLDNGILEFFKLAEEIKCKIMKNDIKLIDNNFIINRIKELLELEDKNINEEEEEQMDENKNYDIKILSIAINEGNKEIFDMLISSKEDINSLNLYEMPPLSIAIMNNNIKFVQILLSREDLNVNMVDSEGLKPINYAVRLAKRTGDFDILKFLINDSRFEISDEEIEMFGQRDKYLDNCNRVMKKEPYPENLDIEVVNILREVKGRNNSIKNQKHLVKDMFDISKKLDDDDKHYDEKPL